MNNVSIKTVVHTISEAPLAAALRTYAQHRSVPAASEAMITRMAVDAMHLQRRVAELQAELLRMKREMA